MSREIMIIAKDKNGVISNNIVKIGENGEHIVIKGTKDTFYEIKDMATNRAPDQIYTKRFKNDLKLKINPKGGALDGVGEADVTIENYCANGNCEIVGVHESGEYYQYVPQSGDADLGTTKMADGEFAYQSLGTVEAGGFSPLSALPLAGLAGLGGGGGSKGDTTAPDAPNLTMVTDGFDRQPILNSTLWGAYDDSGSLKIDSATGKWVVDSGHISVSDDGKIITNDNTLTFNGTGGEAGATVAVYDGTILLGSAIVDSNGDWKVTIDDDKALADGEYALVLTQADAAGNVSSNTTVDVVVDTEYPIFANAFDITDANGRNSRAYQDHSAGDNYYFTNEFTLSDDLGSMIPYPTINDTPYEEGDIIYIELKNATTGDTYHIIDSALGIEASAIVDSNGKWSIDVSSVTAYNITSKTYEALLDGEYSIQYTIVEPSGNISYLNHAVGFMAIDTTVPEANNIDMFVRQDSTQNLVLEGNINDYATLSTVLTGDNGDGIYDRDDDFLIGTTASKLYISRSDDSGSYTSVGEVNIGQSSTSAWEWKDTNITHDGVYAYKVETLDVAGNASGFGDVFYAVVDADRNGSYAGATTNVIGTNGDDIFQTDIANLSFKLDGGAGIDTLIINPSSSSTLTLDSSKTANFEIYNLGSSSSFTLKIDSLASVQSEGSSYTDHALTIEGTGKVDIDLGTWHTSTTTTVDSVTYNIYHNDAATDITSDLWIRAGMQVI